jgi:hypothetical protein
MLVLASGLVLGEGVMAVVTALLKALGMEAATCWGCPAAPLAGICGGCYVNGTLVGAAE